MIESLTDPKHGRISTVADIYRMSVENLAECCSGTKMAQKCHAVLHANKSVKLELVLASLNIPNFGTATATDVVRAGFDTVEKVLSMDYDGLIAVPNVGEKTSRQVLEGLDAHRELLLDLETVLDIQPPGEGPLDGKAICITGELSMPRKAAEKLIMDAGGTPKGSVSKKTAFLVTNDPDTGSGKMKKAKKYGVPIINEDQLMQLVSGPSA